MTKKKDREAEGYTAGDKNIFTFKKKREKNDNKKLAAEKYGYILPFNWHQGEQGLGPVQHFMLLAFVFQ